VVAAQMAVLVRQHRQQPPPVEHHHQRQADAQRVDGAAKQPEARHLPDAGIEFVIEIDVVDRRPLDLAADAVQRLEERRRVCPAEFHALGLVEAHPERAQRGPQQPQGEQQQPAPREIEARFPDRGNHPDNDAHRKPETAQHPQVAERGKGRDAASIARTIVRAGVLAQSNQVNKISAIHPTPVKSSPDSF